MKQKKVARWPAQREVEDAIKDIRAFLRLGRGLNRRHSKRAAYRKKAMKKEAASRKRGLQMLILARLFADRYGSDEQREKLEELFGLSKTKRFVLRKTHFIHLLRVPVAKERQRLQQKVVMERWSTTTLSRYVTAHYAKRGGRGRSQLKTVDELGLLSQLEAMCDTWQRFKTQLKEEKVELPKRVNQQFKIVACDIDELELRVGNEIMRQSPTRLARRVERTTAEKNVKREADSGKRRSPAVKIQKLVFVMIGKPGKTQGSRMRSYSSWGD